MTGSDITRLAASAAPFVPGHSSWSSNVDPMKVPLPDFDGLPLSPPRGHEVPLPCRSAAYPQFVEACLSLPQLFRNPEFHGA